MTNEVPFNEPEIDLESISALIPKTRDGDNRARDELIGQIKSYLDLMANRHMDKSLQNKIGPSDVVQQTYTRVIENFDQFRGGTAAEFRGWLKKIVVHEMAKMRRSYRAEKRDIAKEQPIEIQTESGHVVTSPTDAQPTPSAKAIAAERIENFHEIMKQLPEDYARVIQLRSIEQLSFKEIAERMDRSPDSAAKLWYRAVLKFEELLNESGNFNSGI